MRRNLREQSPPAQRGHHAKVSHQFRRKSIVDPPFMPLITAASPDAEQNQAKRSQFEHNTGELGLARKVQGDRQKRQENSERGRQIIGGERTAIPVGVKHGKPVRPGEERAKAVDEGPIGFAFSPATRRSPRFEVLEFEPGVRFFGFTDIVTKIFQNTANENPGRCSA